MGLRAAPVLALLSILALPATGLPGQRLTLPAFVGYAHPDPEAMHRIGELGAVKECRGELHFYFETKVKGGMVILLKRMPDAEAGQIVLEIGQLGQARQAATLGMGKQQETFLMGLPAIDAGTWHLSLRMPDGSPLVGLAAIELVGTALEGAHASTVERRNAASVHLGYPVPKAHAQDIEWFYCEVTPRTDPLWTYYMATGWHRGYFGMQINSAKERRLIFSVWDSGNEGVDRNKVAAEDRVQLVAKGDGVVADSFGNEGTGGHSHLVHDWKLGDTFRFLVHAQPDGTHTTYTGWFWFAKEGRWGLIASFRAPKDGGRLRGLYSFNENFSGANGDLLRDCEFGNVWARTSGGEWLALTTARFTHDGHGKELRLDRSAGVRGNRFYLQNGGFVTPAADAVTAAHAALTVPQSAGKPPEDGSLPQLPAGDGRR